MVITVLYRKNSGEVVKISQKGQTFADRNQTYWGVLADPSMPDGNQCRDEGYNLRVLGIAKIVDAGTVRNATQVEIDSFPAVEDDDENQQDADGAIELFEQHPRFRKMMVAFADILKDEFNILRQWQMDFKAAVDAAGNLANLKNNIAALPDLPERNLAQLKTAIQNRISKDD
jgi:hypothetical protein